MSGVPATILPMDIVWPLAIAALGGAVWIVMTKLKAALARDDLRGLAATKEISFAAAVLAGGIMFIGLRSGSVVFLVAFIATCIAMITASVTSRILRRAESQGSPTMRAYVRYRCAMKWRATKFMTKRFFMLAAPDGWREVRITVDTFDKVVSVPTVLRVMGVMYIVVLVFVFAMTFAGVTGANSEIQSTVLSVAISYNMLAISCLLTVTVVICFVVFLFLRWGGVLQRPLGVGSYVRRVATWIGYGGAVGAVLASLVPVAALALSSLMRPAESASALSTITPRSMLDFPAAGAVAGYAFGLIVATASLFPDSKNSWLRRVMCPGSFVVVLVALSHWLGGPRGLLRPVIDEAAQRAGFNEASCTSAVPTDIGSASLDATAWVITAMDRCGSGLLISSTAVGWVVVIAALLVGVSLFAVDIRDRAQSEDESSGDSGPVSPAPSQRQTGST